MRNWKRSMRLALASAMLLSMTIVVANAKVYQDVTSDHNEEAIEVLQAAGIMVGKDEDTFAPDATVTRAEMATVMSRMMGLDTKDLSASDIPFTDVPGWAIPHVAACYVEGITVGIGDAAYGSSEPVTAVQAALMMMRALGYFRYPGEFEQDWQTTIIKRASEIDLLNGVDVDYTSPLTRNDVAQMTMNALKAHIVDLDAEIGA